MSHYKINLKDIFFILKEQLNYGNLCNFERYREIDEATLDMLVNEAAKFALSEIAPLQEIGEKWGAVYENGQVRCAPEFKKAFDLYGANGWTAAVRDPEYGGQGFPHMMRIIINDLMYGACQSFNMAPSLTHGAGHLIESFGSEELKSRYIPNMFSGKWAGTMALTEPNAGSNLAAIRTTAYREGDHFRIKGNKIFISWGDHDLTENIVHLLLARIEERPPVSGGFPFLWFPRRESFRTERSESQTMCFAGELKRNSVCTHLPPASSFSVKTTAASDICAVRKTKAWLTCFR